MTVTILIYVVTITAGYTQRIISPQPSELQNLCPGEEVTITCKTRGSALLAWASEEYIGARGTRLEFATFNNIGDIRTSHMNPNTVATLINKTVEDGVQVLVSQLRITAQSQFMNPSVTCTNGRFGTQNTTRLHILGMFHRPPHSRSAKDRYFQWVLMMLPLAIFDQARGSLSCMLYGSGKL